MKKRFMVRMTAVLLVLVLTASSALFSSRVFAETDEDTDVITENSDADDMPEEDADEENGSTDSDTENAGVEEGDEDTDAEGDGNAFTVDNGIPVVYLNIDESQGTIEDMMESMDHSVYCYGSVTITVPEGFHYADFEDLDCESFEDLSMSIRGRGNSTWAEDTPKKPFKIKLDKKADLFGLGANKHWVLVANVYDQTLLEDRITAWLGDQMGFDFTPRGVPVDVVMTGESFGSRYLGSYYFSENVRVGENRLEIEELDEDDTDPDVITGGYLLQNSLQVRQDSPDRFVTSRGAKWATHTPSFDTEEDALLTGEPEEETEGEEAFAGSELGDAYKNSAQQQYIQEYMQMAEDVLFDGGTAYRELFDVGAAAKYWLVQEITLNGDSYATSSTYIYKDRDKNGQTAKLTWGPLWDFDFAWIHRIIYTGFSYGHLWMKPMFCDREEGGFVQELYHQWPEMRELLIELAEDGGIIDQYAEETRRSAEANHELLHPDKDFDYLGEVEKLKAWIFNRIGWVDENLSMLNDLVHRVTYIADGEVYKNDYLAADEFIYGQEEYPEKEGYTFLGWEDEDGNIISSETKILKDTVLTARYLSDSEATHAEDIAFSKNCDVVERNVHIFMYQIPYEVIPTDAMDKAVEWTSSDESYATVDDYGLVQYQGCGEVTLTAKLRFGGSREYHLTVMDGPVPVPESVYPDTEKIYMAPGAQASLSVSTDPSPAKINAYSYESEDPDIVAVGEYGVLTAVGLGKTRVHIVTTTYGDAGDIVLETWADVIVTEDGSPAEDESEDEPEDEGSDEPEEPEDGDGGEGDTPEGPEDGEGSETPGDQPEDEDGGESAEPPVIDPPTLTVPDVTNMTLEAVQKTLSENQFAYVITTEDTDQTALNGLVVRTDPAAGTSGLPAGSVVMVYIGHYVPKKVTVPDVLGKSLDDAKALTEAGGLTVTVIETETESEELDHTVYRQEPAAGTEAYEGSALILFVYVIPKNEQPEENQESLNSPPPYDPDNYSTHWRERPIPETFDLRNVDTDGDGKGDRCYVPPVRQQNPFSSCWGFAATGAAEISILGSILDYDPEAYKTIDLSEKQLVYFTHTPLDDPDSPQNGEGTVPADINDAQSVYGTGGTPFLAASAYAQGIGPSKEDNPEYGSLFRYYGKEQNTIQRYINGAYRNFCYSDLDDWSIPEDYRFCRDYYLTESFLLPSPTGEKPEDLTAEYQYSPEATELIKEQLLDKRGVCIGFCADASRPDQDLNEEGVYLNNITWAHYTWSDSVLANHAVVIVGWDDNYPKENFLAEHQPPEDGAWLVRNSWGSGECAFPDCGEMNWGIPVQKTDENGSPVFDEQGEPVMVGSGYFWLSYYDRSLVNPESFVFSDAIAPEYVDQHDYLPVSSITVKESADPVRMANVFTADHAQILTGISCITGEMNVSVGYEIYLLCNDFTAPDEGLLAASGTRTFVYGGYHKIEMSDSVFIQQGQAYSVILTMTDEDGSYIRNDSVSNFFEGTINQNGVINEKESFLFRNGVWEDYKTVTDIETAMAMNAYEMAGAEGMTVVCDNFPIKGFSNRITGDISMIFTMPDSSLVMAEGYDTCKIKLYFRGYKEHEMGNPEVEWTFLKGSEAAADLLPQKEGSQVLLTAKKAGTIYLAVHLKNMDDYGTAVLKLEVLPKTPYFAMTPQITYVYTGEPVEPAFIVRSKEGILLTEGEDYTAEFSNNILCGTAEAQFTATEANPDGSIAGPVKTTFVIIPPKTEITEAERTGDTIYISFADVLKIGAEGYEIEYREKGTEEWTVATTEEGETEYTIQNLDRNTSYEVRVRSYVNGIYPLLDMQTKFCSEYSETEVFEAERK